MTKRTTPKTSPVAAGLTVLGPPKVNWPGEPVQVRLGKKPIPVESVAKMFWVTPRTVLGWSKRYPQLPQPTKTDAGWEYPPKAIGLFLRGQGVSVRFV